MSGKRKVPKQGPKMTYTVQTGLRKGTIPLPSKPRKQNVRGDVLTQIGLLDFYRPFTYAGGAL